MRRLQVLGLLAALLPSLALAQSSVMLWELSPGSPDVGDADYVVLRVSDACSLDGLALVVEDSSGASQGCYLRFEGPSPVANGYVLVGGAGLEDAISLAPDFLAECAALSPESGRLCLVDGSGLLDCVAYGQFTGDNSGFGAPADGILSGQALQRVQTTGYNATDWLRSPSADPSLLFQGRVLPPGGLTCSTDGGSGGGDGGTLDPTYLEFPGGGLCPTTALGQGGTSTDGGTSDGGTTSDGGGGGGPPSGGGGSIPYERSGCGCGADRSPAAAPLWALGLLFLLPLFGHRRRRA
ncbi:MAG: hypothetical protein P1V51_05185 [Deltaproteobacteria bacterium]|nr:hypothetical protein [Deltaproteobacteria bacterium]